LEVVSAATEDLTACLPPGVSPTGGPITGTDTATFRQCVGPGAASSLADTTLVELGLARLRMFDLADQRITDLAGFELGLDGVAVTPMADSDTDGPGLVLTGIDVPSIGDPPDQPAPPSGPLSL